MTAAGVKVPKVLWTLVPFVVAHSVQLNTDGFSVKDLVLHFSTRLQPSLAPVLTFSPPPTVNRTRGTTDLGRPAQCGISGTDGDDSGHEGSEENKEI